MSENQLVQKDSIPTPAQVKKYREEALTKLVTTGDLSKLSDIEKMRVYIARCEAIGLKWQALPYDYLKLNGKEVLYLSARGVAQLNLRHKISHQITAISVFDEPEGTFYKVSVKALGADGRFEESTAEVLLFEEEGEWKTEVSKKGNEYSKWYGTGAYIPLDPQRRANARMKCETKAKARATKMLVGEGGYDEYDIEAMPGAEKISGPYPTIDVEATTTSNPTQTSSPADLELQAGEPPQIEQDKEPEGTTIQIPISTLQTATAPTPTNKAVKRGVFQKG